MSWKRIDAYASPVHTGRAKIYRFLYCHCSTDNDIWNCISFLLTARDSIIPGYPWRACTEGAFTNKDVWPGWHKQSDKWALHSVVVSFATSGLFVHKLLYLRNTVALLISPHTSSLVTSWLELEVFVLQRLLLEIYLWSCRHCVHHHLSHWSKLILDGYLGNLPFFLLLHLQSRLVDSMLCLWPGNVCFEILMGLTHLFSLKYLKGLVLIVLLP